MQIPRQPKESMKKLKFTDVRRSSVACFSAIVGLSTLLLPTRQAQAAKFCSTSVSDGPTWLETQAHVGDNVHFVIDLNAVGDPLFGVCRLTGGTNWVVFPSGANEIIVAGYSKATCPNPLTIHCPKSGDTRCVGNIPTVTIGGIEWFEYKVQPGDV